MAEYDDFDEIYGDEYEALLEVEGTPQKTCAIQKTQASEDLFQTQNQTIDPEQTTPAPQTQPAKRTLEELFGDIDDILAESPYINAPFPKRTKKDPKEEDLQLIERILQLREAAKYPLDAPTGIGALPLSELYDAAYSMSYVKPKWPHVKITQLDGRVKYVRFHNLAFQEREVNEVLEKYRFVEGETSSAFKETMKEAHDIMRRQDGNQQQENNPSISNLTETCILDSTSLWAEKYKPKRYLELLSDESTNRTLLRWLKLWDKVVFNKKPKLKPLVNAGKSFQNVAGKFPKFQKFVRQDVALKLGEDGRPEFKIALLCGPPGLGKTTLAHLVARHAGYNPVEVNASDDRSVESFRATLDRGTRMRSILDRDNRPNCIVFDEIDGAPPASVQFLIKYASSVSKGGKGAKDKKVQVLKRPIICICNDMYVPALRPLRQISFLVNFPPTENARLAERLLEISTKETIDTNLTALLALSEKSNNDIRSCLSVLQFFRAQNKPVRLDDVLSSSVGQKDIQKGLFTIWRDVFQIQKPTNRDKAQEITAHSRMSQVLSSIIAFGDYGRVMQGIFENYPTMKVKGQRCVPDICSSLEWFSLFDLTSERMMRTQNYGLNQYLPYAFVAWHFTFASFAWQKVQYPNADYEVRTKQSRNIGLLGEILKGSQTYLKPYVHKKNLSQDILPFMSNIIAPTFRPVNTHLYTDEEKQRLRDIVSKMIDYNITYVQERTVDGEYVYNMDPNISDLTDFSVIQKKPRQISYSNKQLISREIELEKMRRIVDFKTNRDPNENGQNKDENTSKNKENLEKDDKRPEKTKRALPNHLQQLKIIKKVENKPRSVERDIFGNILEKSKSARVQLDVINDVCFVYNEGFTNAVRRPILMKDLI